MEPLTNLQIQPLTLDGMAALGAVSPDGRFLAYQPYGQSAVRVRQISGETDIPIVAAGRFSQIFSLTVTADNNSVDVVAVTEQARGPDAWRVPLLGGNPRQILRNVGSAIGWSPDGRKMAFIRASDRAGEMTVVSADADGANQRELATRREPEAFYGHLTSRVGGPPSRPAWSADGRSIVLAGYSTQKRGVTDFVFLDAQTGAMHRSFSISGVWPEVTWLDEKRLLLVGTDIRGREGASGVWVSDLDGRHLTPVTREFGFFGDLTVTADRATAVVKKFTRVSGIWTGVASGQGAQLTVPVSPAGAALPSLDGRGGLTYTAFTASGVAAVFHLPQGSSTAVQVVDATPVPFAGQFYDVSSDGRTIVYTDVEPPHGLFKVRNDGSDRVKLVESDAGLPRLTPDGQTVLFMRRTPGIYSVPVAGGAISTVSERVIPTTVNAGRRNPFSISPDGKRLLFGTDQPGVVVLCELPACSNPQNLRLRSVQWAPDGAGVAYVEGTTTIMEQPLDGGAPRQIAKLDGNEPIINFRWSPDGSRLAASRGTYPNDMVIIKGLR
jgi:Tol biopolymer transport system component